jgi:hypothetical protein
MALGPPIQAQSGRTVETSARSWYIYSGDHPIGGRWEAHIEAQVRRSDFASEWNSLRFRNALNFNLTGSVVLTGGFFYALEFPTGNLSPSTSEKRIYEQAVISQGAGSWDIGHRVRFEQVFQEGSPAYENRFRYAIQPRRRLTPNYYLQLSAEAIVRFGIDQQGRAFDQLRLYGALGRRLSQYWRVEGGYMQQYVVPQFGQTYQSNHILRFSVLSDVPFR